MGISSLFGSKPRWVLYKTKRSETVRDSYSFNTANVNYELMFIKDSKIDFDASKWPRDHFFIEANDDKSVLIKKADSFNDIEEKNYLNQIYNEFGHYESMDSFPFPMFDEEW